jgi:hypothetical protein
VKIKIKNKSEGKNKFLIGGLNWKEKNNNKKKKNENQIKKKMHHELGLNDEVENNKCF